jgi:thiol-disulfide isomerase/thioredoxin
MNSPNAPPDPIQAASPERPERDGAPRPDRRRNLLIAGVAATAACFGSLLALRHSGTGGSFGGTSVGGNEDQLWRAAFETPEGNALDLSALRGRKLLVNFWATWCPPCIAELPLLDQFHSTQDANGWQVLGLAVDQPSSVRKFLARTPVRFPIGMAGLAGTELSKSLGNTEGGLPYSVLFDASGHITARKMGQLKPDELVKLTAPI